MLFMRYTLFKIHYFFLHEENKVDPTDYKVKYLLVFIYAEPDTIIAS